MNQSGEAILNYPQPGGHIVYPYSEEAQVARAVATYASAGLRRSEAVILVMTHDHARAIRRNLKEEGFDLGYLERTGLLACADAAELLCSFMADGVPDERAFKVKIGSMIEKAKATGGNRAPRPVRIFGEMVSLIWKPHLDATERLEELWNEMIELHSVPLLCAYALAGAGRGAFPEALLSRHTHTLG